MTELKELKVRAEDITDPIGIHKTPEIDIPYIRSDVKMNVFYETKHDIPCPPGMGEGVSNDHMINEWVFNHLPMKEDEKKILLHQLKMDDLKEIREEETESIKKSELQAKKSKKKITRGSSRSGVKEEHNFKS